MAVEVQEDWIVLHVSVLERQRRALVLLIHQRLDIYVMQYLTNKHFLKIQMIFSCEKWKVFRSIACYCQLVRKDC